MRGIYLNTKIFLTKGFHTRKVSLPTWFNITIKILAGDNIIYWEILASVTHSELHLSIYLDNNGV